MQGTDLPGNDADDQPAIAYLDQNDALARTECYAADDPHATLAESFAARQLAGQPGGAEQQSENEEQGQRRLQVGAGRNAGADGVATPRGDRQQQWKEKAQQVGDRVRKESGRYLKPKPENWLCYGQPEKFAKIESLPGIANGNPGRQSAVELTHALRWRDDIGQTDTELVVDDNDFALRYERAIDQNVHRLTGHRIEFDDRAVGQLQ